MLSEEEWDKMPDLAFVLEPLIMEYIKGNRDAYTAKEIIENINLHKKIPFNNMELIHVLKGVEHTLQKLEEFGQLHSKMIPTRDSIDRFYRPAN